MNGLQIAKDARQVTSSLAMNQSADVKRVFRVPTPLHPAFDYFPVASAGGTKK
jgi:hypothetical protein